MSRLGLRAIKLKTTIIGTKSSHSKPNKKIRQLQSKYNRVLDVGCGSGKNFIFSLTVGIDADVSILRTTKDKGICLCGDGQNLPFRPNIFDLSLFCYSLEYMENPDQAREEGLRVSKENYELIYPARYSWKNVVEKKEVDWREISKKLWGHCWDCECTSNCPTTDPMASCLYRVKGKKNRDKCCRFPDGGKPCRGKLS